MKYDFTSIIDRHGKDAIAVDGLVPGGHGPQPPKEGFDIIPMWVADMNFPTVPTITQAIAQRIQHPFFGYFATSDDYYNAIIHWQEQRNGVTGLTKECIGYENGVLGGVISALNVLCSKGDNVLLHSPHLHRLYRLPDQQRLPHCPQPPGQGRGGHLPHGLCGHGEENRGEQHPRHGVLLPPQPLRPGVGALGAGKGHGAVSKARRHGHLRRDLVRHHSGGHKHIPLQSISEDARQRTVALYAPSKTFNLAGLIGSYHIIYNKALRDRVDKESSLSHYNSLNVLSMHALVGAYTQEGSDWVDELRQTITGNVDYACGFIAQHFPGVKVQKPQGTYMLFLDCTEWCEAHGKTTDQVQQAGWDVGVAWQDGRAFHGPCHIRMNLALPLSRVQEAFDRLQKYVFVD